MAIFWITDAMHLAVTALLPLLLFPMFGIISARDVSRVYLEDVMVLFMAGLMVAVAIESWNLHRRIALKVILLIGSRPMRLVALSIHQWFPFELSWLASFPEF